MLVCTAADSLSSHNKQKMVNYNSSEVPCLQQCCRPCIADHGAQLKLWQGYWAPPVLTFLSVSAAITLPSALRLALIFLLSSSLLPVAPVICTRSLPARSTRLSLPTCRHMQQNQRLQMASKPIKRFALEGEAENYYQQTW